MDTTATNKVEHAWILFDNDYDEIWDIILMLDGIIDTGEDDGLDGEGAELWEDESLI